MFDLNYIKMMIKYINIIKKTNEPYAYESINKHHYTLKKKENSQIKQEANNDLINELTNEILTYIFEYCSYFRIGITSVNNLSNTTVII